LLSHAADLGRLLFRGHAIQFGVRCLPPSGHDGAIRVWNPDWERAQQVIALGPNQRLLMDLDPSGKYLFAAGHAPVIFVLRFQGEFNHTINPHVGHCAPW
jgi:hypothetical protein